MQVMMKSVVYKRFNGKIGQYFNSFGYEIFININKSKEIIWVHVYLKIVMRYSMTSEMRFVDWAIGYIIAVSPAYTTPITQL